MSDDDTDERTTPFNTSVMITLAGESQAGKNWQIKTVVNYQDPDGSYPFRPALIAAVESSTRGTTGKLFQTGDVVLHGVKTLDDWMEFFRLAIDGHPDGRAYSTIVMDGWTTFQEGLNVEDRIRAIKAAAKLLGAEDGDDDQFSKGRTLDGKDLQNDNFRLAKGAADSTRIALNFFNDLASTIEGVLLLSTVIVRQDLRSVGKGRDIQLVQVGWKTALSPAPAEYLNIYTQLVLYLDVNLPEIDDPADANDCEEEPMYYMLTRRFKVAGLDMKFIKWQDGIVDLPKYYENPDLGSKLGVSPLRRKIFPAPAAPAAVAAKPKKKKPKVVEES
jgi:hypothetical protein